jgi:hypothetical protein
MALDPRHPAPVQFYVVVKSFPKRAQSFHLSVITCALLFSSATLCFADPPASAPTPTPPPTVSVSADDVHATQMEIGFAYVQADIAKIFNKDPDPVKAVPMRTLPGYRDPDGGIWISDGHHWAKASEQIADKLKQTDPAKAAQIHLSVELDGDFMKPKGVPSTDADWLGFVKLLHNSGVGYFTPEARAKYETALPDGSKTISDQNLVKMYRTELPKLPQLTDSPGRSVFGLAFTEIGISANKYLADYIQFYAKDQFANVLKNDGVDFSKLTDPASITQDVQDRASRIIATNPEIISFLLAHSRPGVDPADEQHYIMKKINKYRLTLTLPPLDPATLTKEACVTNAIINTTQRIKQP